MVVVDTVVDTAEDMAEAMEVVITVAVMEGDMAVGEATEEVIMVTEATIIMDMEDTEIIGVAVTEGMDVMAAADLD